MGYKLKKIYVGDKQVFPEIPNYLCFTANTAGSTVQLTKIGSPYSVTLETSTNGYNWTTYTIGDTITLSNIGDKVYFRNTSETTTGFGSGTNSYYQFSITGSVAGSGDITYLINKNGTTTLVSSYCFFGLFAFQTALTTPPRLPATSLATYGYSQMFNGCSNLEVLPALPATTVPAYCYQIMFANCTKIKLSTTKTGEYQTAYRIPTNGTGSAGTNALYSMFYNTGGTFNNPGTPSINTNYYTSNTVV